MRKWCPLTHLDVRRDAVRATMKGPGIDVRAEALLDPFSLIVALQYMGRESLSITENSVDYVGGLRRSCWMEEDAAAQYLTSLPCSIVLVAHRSNEEHLLFGHPHVLSGFLVRDRHRSLVCLEMLGAFSRVPNSIGK